MKRVLILLIFLASLPVSLLAASKDEQQCLALNIYFEARSEPVEGQMAVAMVTLNRVFAEEFPDNICDVVWQFKQFSWTHDGKSDKPTEELSWEVANIVANYVLSHYHSIKTLPKYLDNTGGALWYYNPKLVLPYWHTERKIVTKSIGNHRFLRKRI